MSVEDDGCSIIIFEQSSETTEFVILRPNGGVAQMVRAWDS